ncbi:MAG: CHASE4 domain-containing protein, partial [Actinomycetota bacterium]|nr:CHASE4 domain-containing protein [Actinomycetota bacterium]
MNLRRRITLQLIAAMLVSSITVFAVAYVAIMNSAGKVERQVVSADTGRAARALDQPVRLLERVAGDWAPWDETYLFLSGENPGYIEDNLSFETVDNLGVNFLAFFDSNRQSVHVTAFDLETGAPID